MQHPLSGILFAGGEKMKNSEKNAEYTGCLRMERRAGHRHFALVNEAGETLGFVYGTRRDEVSELIAHGQGFDCIGCPLVDRLKRLEYEAGLSKRTEKEDEKQ